MSLGFPLGSLKKSRRSMLAILDHFGESAEMFLQLKVIPDGRIGGTIRFHPDLFSGAARVGVGWRGVARGGVACRGVGAVAWRGGSNESVRAC